jgi:hypothetical protein
VAGGCDTTRKSSAGDKELAVGHYDIDHRHGFPAWVAGRLLGRAAMNLAGLNQFPCGSGGLLCFRVQDVLRIGYPAAWLRQRRHVL